MAVIPLILIFAAAFDNTQKPWVYLFSFFLVASLKSTEWAIVLVGTTFIIFKATKFKIGNSVVTKLLLGGLILLGLSSSIAIYSETSLSWIWILLHYTFLLKILSWAVSVRLYKQNYSINEFLNFFFHPCFFFFTNDLNVLTPKLFFQATSTNVTVNIINTVRLATVGLMLLILYGLIQKYYFSNIYNVRNLYHPLAGGAISIVTAVIFHAGNVFVQVSFLNAQGYKINHDMDRPWLAVSPSDYWRRMHYYVRDFINEIIAKPIILSSMRSPSKGLFTNKFVVMLVVYLVFISTQIGYQPFRSERTLTVGFIVTALFVAMFAASEFVFKSRLKTRSKWVGRLVTFLILYIGYTFVFYTRQGF